MLDVILSVESFLGVDIATAALIILNLIIIESLLSIDNAAVIATMVMDLPKSQRGKALRYGIIGAYVFRGLCLIFAAYLMEIAWLKAAGGIYLIFLMVHHFYKRNVPDEPEKVKAKNESFFYKYTVGLFGVFWSTVILVELMDLAFSIDNVFAAVALAQNIPNPQKLYIVCFGVFVGILAMRFVAQGFVRLLEKYPFMITSAFLVIGLLGAKLLLSFICEEVGRGNFCELINGHNADMWVSVLTIAIFVVPIITSKLFNFPKAEHHPELKEIEELEAIEDRLEEEDKTDK
jgi:YkoY family integral membrane protein